MSEIKEKEIDVANSVKDEGKSNEQDLKSNSGLNRNIKSNTPFDRNFERNYRKKANESGSTEEEIEQVTLPTVEDLVNDGVLFGEKRRFTHPRMYKYIAKAGATRNDHNIINLDETVKLLKNACDFLYSVTSKGGKVLFVGTKETAKEVIEQQAKALGMPYIISRWSPGILTNFTTVMKTLRNQKNLEGNLNSKFYTKKERTNLKRRLDKMDLIYAGMRDLNELPKAIILVDGLREKICITEASKLKIPVIGIIDTNCDPSKIQYPIPANDDSNKSISILMKPMVDFIMNGVKKYASKKRFEPVTNNEKYGRPANNSPERNRFANRKFETERKYGTSDRFKQDRNSNPNSNPNPNTGRNLRQNANQDASQNINQKQETVVENNNQE